jgi:hypothetical protein
MTTQLRETIVPRFIRGKPSKEVAERKRAESHGAQQRNTKRIVAEAPA